LNDLFLGNTRLADSTFHSCKTLKNPARKLLAYTVQSEVKVNSSCWEGETEESCSIKGEREKGRESNRNRFEAGFSGAHNYSFLDFN
jgi:hypothetical protein